MGGAEKCEYQKSIIWPLGSGMRRICVFEMNFRLQMDKPQRIDTDGGKRVCQSSAPGGKWGGGGPPNQPDCRDTTISKYQCNWLRRMTGYPALRFKANS